MGSFTRVRVADDGDKTRISVFTVEGVEGVGMGKVGVGDEIWFTNLRSLSSYVFHSTAVRV